MYRDHVAIISAGMRADPDTFARGVTFAFLSIRTQFPRVAEQMRQVDAAGHKAQALWGYKRGAYDYLRKNKFSLWGAMLEARLPENALEIVSAVPGIGIVKAGFVAQMMGFDIGCLDTRNIQRLGLNPREWRSDGEPYKNTLAFKRKIARYVEYTYGRAEELWDDWCTDVAGVYKVTAEEISRDHLVIVPPEVRRVIKIEPVPMFGHHTDIPFAA